MGVLVFLQYLSAHEPTAQLAAELADAYASRRGSPRLARTTGTVR
jgi:hypothetical protein